MRGPVVITGVGSVNAAFSGGADALHAWLAAPRAPRTAVVDGALAALIQEGEARRLSRVSRLAVAGARLALADAGLEAGAEIGLVIGTEFGDMRSTIEFADGYLASGPSGLSALLFPNTVMNTMAAATAIAVTARELTLTLNEPTIAGQLAVAQAALAVAQGRVSAALAGGVDEADPFRGDVLETLGGSPDRRGEGSTLLVLEAREAARARGARILGEIRAAVWRTVRARPHGVGDDGDQRAVATALARAGLAAARVPWVYASASGDVQRDAWEERLLERALAPHRPPRVRLSPLVGQHAGAGARVVAAAAWTARAGRMPGGAPVTAPGPGLVHGIARGGGHIALVVA
jgi:3-oxoacyl-[acyl-carrier-protein] synthase II